MSVTSKLLMLIHSDFRMGKKINKVVCKRREGGQRMENETGWRKELGRENGKGSEEIKRSSKNKSKKKDNMDGQQDLKNMSTMSCSKNEIDHNGNEMFSHG